MNALERIAVSGMISAGVICTTVILYFMWNLLILGHVLPIPSLESKVLFGGIAIFGLSAILLAVVFLVKK